MYLRTTQRKNQDGSVVQYYQLAHNRWDPATRRSETRIIHNFGRADALDRNDLVRLCQSIARVCGLEVRDPSEACSAEEPTAAARKLPWPEGLKQYQSRSLGPVWVIESLWERLGLREHLQKLAQQSGVSPLQERALLAMTANRLCEPLSKLGVWERWLRTVYLPSCEELGRHHFYEAMDLLCRHAAEVERAVFLRVSDLLSLEVDVVFYDTTNVSFCIDEADEPEEDGGGMLRRWGLSKEGGSRVQVVVALAVTRDGLPVRSWVFPGNKADASTVARVKADLRDWQLGRCLFVGDAGFDSEDNRRELARGCGKYLLCCRAGSVKEIREHVLSRAGRYQKLSERLEVKEVVVGDGELRRRYFVCFNPREAERQSQHRTEVLAELERELGAHSSLQATAKWATELRASKRTGPYLSVNRRGELFLDKAKVREAARFDGKWVLITNDDTLSAAEAASGYKAALVIENCFRTLKSAQIELQPLYHRLDRRIEAHIKICVLALLLERIAERQCKRPWSRLLQDLGELQATEFRTAKHRFFRRNELTDGPHRILKSLKIQKPKLVLSVE